MPKTIMVPLDGSTFAEQALPAALSIARECHGHVHLIQTHEIPVMAASPDLLVPFDASWDGTLRDQEREYLDSVALRAAEKAGVTVRTELLDGVPAAVLSAYAREMSVDLIVMTTHGRGGLSRLWLGSVADGVVRSSGVPVLLQRPDDVVDPVDLTAGLEMSHILVPLDGSDLSLGALEPATWLGSMGGARYTLLRVTLPMLALRAVGPVPDPDFAEKLLAEQDSEATSWIEAIAEPLREAGLDVTAAVSSSSAVAGSILEYAHEADVDLIAIATHGRGGLKRIALGSVADKVLRGSEVPVVLYRPAVSDDDADHAAGG